MKSASRHLFALTAVIFMLTAYFSYAQEQPEGVMEKLNGKWIMQKTRLGMQEGYFVFRSGGKYELFEKHPDGTGVTRKGSFRIQTAKLPYLIVWGQDNLDAPGAEWTSNFAIFRFLDDGRLEIKVSASGEYPADFARDATTDDQTMILHRE